MNTRTFGNVSFEKKDGRFVAFLSMQDLLSAEMDPQTTIEKAAALYEASTTKMRALIAEINEFRVSRKSPPARLVWRLGDQVFKLKHELAGLFLEMVDVYLHLERDLAEKRKWLEKVIILRRYVPKEDLIPVPLRWSNFEKSTRKKAERITKGLPLET